MTIFNVLSLSVKLVAVAAIIFVFTLAAAIASVFALVGFCVWQVANAALKLLRVL